MSHYYHQNGEDCYSIIGKNGKPRKPNIRDAKKLDLVPSVTTILNDVVAKPELIKWKINQVYGACRDYPELINNKSAIMDKAYEKSEKAMEWGNILHSYMEQVVWNKYPDLEFAIIPQATKKAIDNHMRGIEPIAIEKAFVRLGYGGKADLLCKVDEKTCIFDYKNQATKDKKHLVYDTTEIQIAAYMILTGAEIGKVLTVSRDEPGMVWTDTIDHKKAQKLWLHYLNIYKIKKGLRK